MKPTPIIFWVPFLVALPAALAPDRPTSAFHRTYFDREVPLVLDPERIAWFHPGGEALPADIGVEPIEGHPIAGWSLLATPATHRSEGGIRALVGTLAASGAGFFSPVFLDDLGGPLIVTPDVLVGFEPWVTKSRIETLLAERFGDAELEPGWGGMPGTWRARSSFTDGVDVLDSANALAALPEVLFAEPDFIFTGSGGQVLPDDPGFEECWGIHNVGQGFASPDMDLDGPEAWSITTGDPSIKVLIIDTGVQQDHPDINQLPGMDFTTDTGFGGPVNPCDNHGTAVAGCVSARRGNGLGTVGIAPDCNSVSSRTFISISSCGGGWTAQLSWTVDALAWAETIGVRVTNNSNFYGTTSAAVDQKYAQTETAGMIHFAIAGNFALPSISYPGSLPSVNAVAALYPTGERAEFSNFGNGLAFSAPGVDIYTTDRTSADGYTDFDYVWIWGTSFATPYTAGVAALVLSVDPTLGADEVEAVLQASAVDLGQRGYDTDYGWGFVNAWAALRELASPGLAGQSSVVGIAEPGGNRASVHTSLSEDGRYVAFESAADDLVPGDVNGERDVFVRDRLLGTTELVSVTSSGTQGNGPSRRPSISDDGRFVAFTSEASNLVSLDLGAHRDVFVHDRLNGTTVRASVSSLGFQANDDCRSPEISGDGRWVAFASRATNLATTPLTPVLRIFLRDLQTGTTTHVSVSTTGAASFTDDSRNPSISDDGRYIAFESTSALLSSGDSNFFSDVFVHDRSAGTTLRVSVSTSGLLANGPSWNPAISGDGSAVAFYSFASILQPGDSNGVTDVFVHELATGTTDMVSVSSAGAQGDRASYEAAISDDGRYVAFESAATNFDPNDTNGVFDVFGHDRQTGATFRLSLGSVGQQATRACAQPRLTAQGDRVGFTTPARNLIAGDTNGVHDTFLRDLATVVTERTSLEN